VHKHGGAWTDNKLEVMQRYFSAYAKALQYSPRRDKPFKRWYVDAFAGTGERVDSRAASSGDQSSIFEEDGEDITQAKDGSVRIALNIQPKFDRYFFVDKSDNHISKLNDLKAEFSSCEIDVVLGDANAALRNVAAKIDRNTTRAAIFIDPYGMQVDWTTLQTLSRTKAVDIALLFPTGPLNRMLTRNGKIPQEWSDRIDSHLGECNWLTASYKTDFETDLFSVQTSSTKKSISTDGLRQFVLERLQSIFAYVCPEQLEMKNSKGSVLYHLFIICANDSSNAKLLADKLASSAVRLPKTKK
jgi:three-Cys-motif partner protein